MVLGCAKAVMEKGISSGKLYILFQPAEEKLDGAKTMIKSGLIDDMTEIVGIHVRPIDDTSIGHATPAVYHGSSAQVIITIKGLSAHGARLHLGINAVDAAVLVAGAINSVRVNPLIPHSAKVTQINTGSGSRNIIPDNVTMAVDVRCHDNDEMTKLLEKIKEAAAYSAKAIGAKAKAEVIGCVPAAVYDEEMKATAREAIKEVLGEEGLLADMYNPGGEDFHFFTLDMGLKAAYIGLGADVTPGLHHKDMTLNPDALPGGAEILSRIIHKRLGVNSEING